MEDSKAPSSEPGSGARQGARQTPEQRRRVMSALYPEPHDRGHWWFRFAVMMTLSVVVAVMGMSEDSAAVVIGAMLIAPLMTPVLGIGAGVAMGWPVRIRQSALATVAGTIGSIAVSWFLTTILPASDKVLNAEVLSRTSPDLRDLVIGLAAGAAGAYAVSREDISAALPGVAVAVALVPPLASAGFTLAIGRSDLADGALLLYGTNMVAIVLAATFVFLFTGFVPFGRRQRAAGKIRFGIVAVVIFVVGVSIPLGIRSFAAAEHATTTRRVNEAALLWLSSVPGLKLDSVAITGTHVTVAVEGPAQPPSSASLAHSLESVLGPTVGVEVRWFQTGVSSQHPAVTAPTPLDAALVRPVVEGWLAGVEGTKITRIEVRGDTVTVDLSGSTAPPTATRLADLIEKRTGRSVNVEVNWSTPSKTTPPTTGTTTSTKTTSSTSSTGSSTVRAGTGAQRPTPSP